MAKFNLKDIGVGETKYFEPAPLGYRDLNHLRRNLGVVVHNFIKSNPDKVITTMTVNGRLSVRRWQ